MSPPIELFADSAATTLASSPGIGATSFTVASSTGFPAASNAAVPPTQFRVLVGSEMVTVLNVAGTTWTVAPLTAAHTSGDAVTHVVFADTLRGLQYPQNAVAPTGADYETFPRNTGYTSALPLSTGSLQLSAIAIPKDFIVKQIGFISSAAATSPTYCWFGLYDKNRVQLALTANQGAAAWPASTLKSLPVATTAAGAATSFTTTYAGMHYLGVMVTAATPPSITSAYMNTGLMPQTPLLGGAPGSAGMTTPPAFPSTVAALVATAPLYGFVGGA